MTDLDALLAKLPEAMHALRAIDRFDAAQIVSDSAVTLREQRDRAERAEAERDALLDVIDVAKKMRENHTHDVANAFDAALAKVEASADAARPRSG